MVLRDLLCNHPSCETIVWQIEGKSVLQFVVSLSSCTYRIVLGKHPWVLTGHAPKLRVGIWMEKVLYWFNPVLTTDAKVPAENKIDLYCRFTNASSRPDQWLRKLYHARKQTLIALQSLSLALCKFRIANEEHCKRSYRQCVWNLFSTLAQKITCQSFNCKLQSFRPVIQFPVILPCHHHCVL